MSSGNSPYIYSTLSTGSITTLTIGSNVTRIPDYAFKGSSILTGDFTIPDSVTYIGQYAFYGSNISELTIGEGVATIGSYAFWNCPQMQTLHFNAMDCSYSSSEPMFNSGTSSSGNSAIVNLTIGGNVTKIPTRAFQNSVNITGNLLLPNSVIHIGSFAFYGCTGLNGPLTLGNSISTIGSYAFYGCTGFSGLTLGNSVSTIGSYAFYGCTGFGGPLTLGNSVSTIGNYAFYGCTGFSGSLTLNDSLTQIGQNAFYGCNGFTGHIVIPDAVQEIGSAAFIGCSHITELTLGEGIVSIGSSAFANCPSLTSIHFNAINCSTMYTTYLDDNGLIQNRSVFGYPNQISTLTIGDNVTKIPDYAFRYCNHITEITINEGITEIGKCAFWNCSSLTTVHFNATNCSTMQSYENSSYYSVFNTSGALDPITTLTIGENVTNIPNYAFHNCRNITGSLNIPASVTSIGYKAFYYCNAFTKIHANSETPPTVGTQAFYGMNHSVPVFVPCGTRPLYIAASGWSDFTNYPLSPADLEVSVNSEYLGEATISLLGTCDDSESTVHAEPYPGCAFTNWTVEGEVVSTDLDYTFNLTEDITLIANFEIAPNHHLFVGTNSNLWNCSGNWLPQELPTENSTVVLHANVTVDTIVTVADVYFYGNSRLTISSVGSFTVTDEIVPSETSSIGISDGGQLFHSVEGIEASIYKTITPYTDGERDGWHLISNPLANDVDISEVQNLADSINFDNYDLYYYDEPSCYWMNQKDAANGFTEMGIGKGYLYGNNCIGLISTNKEYNFESGAPGWTIIDADGDGNVWFLYGNSSTAHSYTIQLMSESYYQGQLFPDNYLISPQLNFGSISSITFWARALDANNPAEHFGVAVSVTGNTETTDFTTIQEWTLNDGNWHRYTVNLDQYSGQKGYVAIRHFNCHGQSALLIDDVVFEDIIVSFPWNSMSIAFSGELQNGVAEVNVPLSYTPNTPLSGFNLVGNPYAHNVTSYASENVANGCYRMNEAKNDLIVSEISEANPLKPAEGFFVKATATDASITFNPTNNTKQPKSLICVEVAENEKLIDRLIVKTVEGQPLEKFSLNEHRTRLFAQDGNQELAIVPCEGNEQAVNFKAAKNGQYTINVNADGMEFNYLHLIDNLTGVDVDLLTAPCYTFEAKTSDYASRFLLRFIPKDDAADNSETFAFISNGNIVIIDADANSTLQIIDMTGRVVVSTDVVRNISTSGMVSGVYVLRLINGNDVKTQKIVVE